MEDAEEQEITLSEMRGAGVTGPLVYVSDNRRSHHLKINADQWLDERDYRILSHGSSARLAANAAPVFPLLSALRSRNTPPPSRAWLTVTIMQDEDIKLLRRIVL
jgi:hypothetical protein